MPTLSLTPEQIDALEATRAARAAEFKQASEEALKWKDGYELSEVGPHNFAYKSKTAPEHHICPNCYDKNVKSILRLAPNKPARLRCDRCGISIFIETHFDTEIGQLRAKMAEQHLELQAIKSKETSTEA